MKRIILTLACFLAVGCSQPKKTYTLYEFGNLDSSKFHAKETRVHSVTSSLQGMVYVAGQTEDHTVVIDRTDGSSWQQIDLTTGKTPKGGALSLAIKHANARLEVTSPLHDGVIIYTYQDPYLMGILKDETPEAAIVWKAPEATFTHHPLSFIERKDEKYLILATSNVAEDGLRSFEVGSDKDEWTGGYKKTASKDLDIIFTSTTINSANDVLLAGKDRQIYLMNNASFTDKLLANNGDPVVPAVDLQRGSFANGDISKILFVDKYLLVGFKADGKKEGGLFFRDVSAGLPESSSQSQWDNVGEGRTITCMMVDRNNAKRAVIGTNKGILIFEDGKLQHFTRLMMFDPNNQGSLKKEAPKNGIAGGMKNDSITSIAQDKDGKFYFSTPEGIATLMIRSEDL